MSRLELTLAPIRSALGRRPARINIGGRGQYVGRIYFFCSSLLATYISTVALPSLPKSSCLVQIYPFHLRAVLAIWTSFITTIAVVRAPLPSPLPPPPLRRRTLPLHSIFPAAAVAAATIAAMKTFDISEPHLYHPCYCPVD
jgi:hypothetical protein